MRREKMKDLILALLYETAWNEEFRGQKMVNSWKGYPFEILNELEEEALIYQTRRSKKVRLSQSGIAKAEKILRVLKEIEWE